MRKTIFVEGEFYHLYNRGTDKRDIFLDDNDFLRFIKSMNEFNVLEPIGSLFENSFRRSAKNNKGKQALGSPASKCSEKLVHVVAYCLNQNHYHFLVKQTSERGVEKFMQRLGTGYTKYFNNKYDRSGVLFQGKFKAIHVDSNEYLLHVSAYVNLNNRVHQLENSASKLRFRSSWNEYTNKLGKGIPSMCDMEIILGQFNKQETYVMFAEASLKGMREQKGLIDESMLLEKVE